MPAISGISASGGYTSGEQELTITGTSLNGTNIAIEVDGSPCTVKSSGIQEIKCVTSQKSVGSSGSTFVGQHGLRHKNYQDASLSNYSSKSVNFEKLMTNFELAYTSEWEKSANKITGYFEPPVDGDY